MLPSSFVTYKNDRSIRKSLAYSNDVKSLSNEFSLINVVKLNFELCFESVHLIRWICWHTKPHHTTTPYHTTYQNTFCLTVSSVYRWNVTKFCSANEHPSKLGEQLFEIYSSAAIFAEHLALTQYTRFCRIFFVRFNHIVGM